MVSILTTKLIIKRGWEEILRGDRHVYGIGGNGFMGIYLFSNSLSYITLYMFSFSHVSHTSIKWFKK